MTTATDNHLHTAEERLLFRLNQIRRERDVLAERLRLAGRSHANLAALRKELAAAIDGLDALLIGPSDANRARVQRAINAMTDAVRVVYAIEEGKS